MESRQVPKGIVEKRPSREKNRTDKTSERTDKRLTGDKRIELSTRKRGNLSHADSSDDEKSEGVQDSDLEEDGDCDEDIIEDGDGKDDGVGMTGDSDEEENIDSGIDDEIEVLDSEDIPTGRGANRGRVDSTGKGNQGRYGIIARPDMQLTPTVARYLFFHCGRC